MGRNNQGQFAPKGDEVRSVRSLRATDHVWDNFGKEANLRRITRADFLEQLFSDDDGNSDASTEATAKDALLAVRRIVGYWERKTDSNKYNPVYKKTIRKMLSELREILG